MDFLKLLIGFTILFISADYLVRVSTVIANKFKLPKVFIGLTIVALGTSVPEILVSVKAGLAGFDSISVGNVIGSNISNILLILGSVALIMPITCDMKTFWNNYIILFVISSVFSIMIYTGWKISVIEGYILLAMLGYFLYYSVKTFKDHSKGEKKYLEEQVDELLEFANHSISFLMLIILISFTGLYIGSDLLIAGASNIAKSFGISEKVIGVTVVAFGTSFPEFMTSIVAAMKKQNSIVFGNVVGSNIWNVLAGIGLSASITELNLSENILTDIIFLMIGTILMIPFFISGKKLCRFEGGIFFILYLTYIYIQYC